MSHPRVKTLPAWVCFATSTLPLGLRSTQGFPVLHASSKLMFPLQRPKQAIHLPASVSQCVLVTDSKISKPCTHVYGTFDIFFSRRCVRMAVVYGVPLALGIAGHDFLHMTLHRRRNM